MISRRDFLKTLSGLAVTSGGTWMILSDPSWQRLFQEGHAGLAFGDSYLDELIKSSPKARYWRPLEIKGSVTPKDQTLIQCLLCANSCVIANGQCGRCRTRMNVKGELR
ncbi:MAG TPA: twin-arginine translocation signal domain-containing protein, partial [Smithella sp.]|nr:twin-arginine translocation signal domain-containing protein [Smithella sp.]